MKFVIVLAVAVFAFAFLALLIRDSTHNELAVLPKFTGIIHYYGGDIKTVYCNIGDLLIKKDENGFDREYWMKGRTQMLKLTMDEVYAIEKVYKVKIVY